MDVRMVMIFYFSFLFDWREDMKMMLITVNSKYLT